MNDISICQNCKYWSKGTVSEYDKEFVWWEYDPENDKTVMKPHPNAGKTINHPVFPSNEHLAECKLANEEVLTNKTKMFTVCSGDSPVLMTDPTFGCLEFTQAAPDWDHWDREYVKNKPRSVK